MMISSSIAKQSVWMYPSERTGRPTWFEHDGQTRIERRLAVGHGRRIVGIALVIGVFHRTLIAGQTFDC